MPIIDGEKWACQSCIKGHRVSGCTHHDRELHHINPKGRPVKQCEHCRGARKSKSHHAKCDCGDKKDKDKAKDKGDTKVDESHCGCHTGSKCVCGVKKEPLDLKLDTTSLKVSTHGLKTKPRLTSTHSESTLTIFANGHHKPCHRLNNAAHVSGAPYKIPRPHTLHGPSAFAHYSHDSLEKMYGQQDVQSQPPRSIDTLSLSNNQFYNLFGSSSASASAERSADSLPLTPLNETVESTNAQVGSQESLFNSQLSLNTLGQDGNSPIDGQPWWASSMPSSTSNAQFGLDSLSTSPSQEYLPNLENDWAIPSAGLNNPLWSAGDLPLNPSKLTDSVAQPISHSGESKHSAPGMTTSSSAQSEIGEPALFGDLDYKPPLSALSGSVTWEDTPAYRFAPSTSASDARPAPTSMPVESSNSPNFDFLKNITDASTFEQGLTFDSNSLFSTTTLDETQPAKTASITPPMTTSQLENPTSFPAIDYSEPRSITIPNSIDDVTSNNAWLPLLDPSTNNNFGVSTAFDMPQYPTWL